MTVDLRTTYLGLELRSPLVASPSPLTRELDSVLQLVEAGAAAVVLPSLFEEEIVHEELELNRSLEAGSEQFAEALDYFPTIEAFAGAGDRYLSTAPPDQGGRRRAGHRQPQRLDARAAGSATRASCRRPARTRSSSTSTTWPPNPARRAASDMEAARLST